MSLARLYTIMFVRRELGRRGNGNPFVRFCNSPISEIPILCVFRVLKERI